jgi:PEP-CTERM motif
MIAIIRLLGLVGRLIMRPLLLTSLITVLCAVICPTARADTLFTTTIQYDDTWNGAFTYGPVANQLFVTTEFNGDANAPVPNTTFSFSAPYANAINTRSQFNGVLYGHGTTEVGTLESSGQIEGYDTIKVKGKLEFQMTIESTRPLPPLSLPAPAIPFRVTPSMEVHAKTETYDPGVATLGSAAASAEIYDVQNHFSTGFSDSAEVTVRGEGSKSINPTLHLEAYEGDTVDYTANTLVILGGTNRPCWDASTKTYYACGSLGAAASATVDPLFEFDQSAFDALMGPATYPLSDYYKFVFSPNIPIAAVPEPSTMLLTGSGLIALAGYGRKKIFKK